MNINQPGHSYLAFIVFSLQGNMIFICFNIQYPDIPLLVHLMLMFADLKVMYFIHNSLLAYFVHISGSFSTFPVAAVYGLFHHIDHHIRTHSVMWLKTNKLINEIFPFATTLWLKIRSIILDRSKGR